ncbi:hypothetical protein J6590_052112 [Homalodisca vitripennis]|nr:hypothetical protein J6590_052112 [Homalodisca vitripennis]
MRRYLALYTMQLCIVTVSPNLAGTYVNNDVCNLRIRYFLKSCRKRSLSTGAAATKLGAATVTGGGGGMETAPGKRGAASAKRRRSQTQARQ